MRLQRLRLLELRIGKSADVSCLSGATMLEYGVMAALISVASIVAVKGIGETVRDKFIEVQLAQGLVEE